MFRIFFVFSLVSAGMAFGLPSEKEWTRGRTIQGTSLWKLKSSPEVRGVYNSVKSPQPADWSRVSSTDIFKKWETPKREMFKMMGITEWKVEDYKWDKEDEGTYKLTAEGSYVGRDKNKVFFHETHFYTAAQTFQVLITSPKKRALNQQLVEGFVQGAKQEWVKEQSS